MPQSSSATFAVPAPAEKSVPSERLVSLDVFRGATIAFMIIVNNQGDEAAYWPLKHAQWNGWTARWIEGTCRPNNETWKEHA